MNMMDTMRLYGAIAASEAQAFDMVRAATPAPAGATVTDGDVLAVVSLAKRAGVSPMAGLVALYQRGDRLAPGISLDGWMAIINQHPMNNGVVFRYSPEPIAVGGKMAHEWVECVISRKDRAHPTAVREYLDDCLEQDQAWATMPNRQLRHRALMQCARVAFGIGGGADEVVQAEAVAPKMPPDAHEPPAATAAPDPADTQQDQASGPARRGMRRRSARPAEPQESLPLAADALGAAEGEPFGQPPARPEPSEPGNAEVHEAPAAPAKVVARLQARLEAFAPTDAERVAILRRAGVTRDHLDGITMPEAQRLTDELEA